MKSTNDLFELSSNYAKDIKSKASNLLRRRHTDASFIDKGIIPSREEIYKWQTSFENLLRHKYGIALFRGFLKTEFSEENIEFWLECEEYKYMNKEIKRMAKSKKIYQDFVAIGSPREVNLDIELRAYTAQNILNPSYDTFDRAQKRIQALMEKDSYPRFLESNLYKNLLGSYSPPLPSQGLNGKINPVCTSSESLSSAKSIQASLNKIFSSSKTNGSQILIEQSRSASTSSSDK
ncbi:unnamed protein product [Brachionus calyciflorus]|uniref:RGS domain-containing protein n=1 Tax=Brachionus calyciflorus TaxID=104777 RepID=A0A814IV90_9BILA|nr:unnamed protein product [Brachionus calyciflorus]